MTTAKEQLREFKNKIEPELKKYLNRKTQEAHLISPFCGELMGHVAEITLRPAKRVRAAILYYSYLAHGGVDQEKAIQASMSMELMQTFLLIHDDIIDGDSLRRGGPTVHKIYEKIGREKYPKANAKKLGNCVAILAGDMASALSNELVAESDFDKASLARALDELNRMYMKEFYGEFLDVLSEVRDDVTARDTILIHQLKTSPYTFDTPLKIGAILAGATDEHIRKLEKYSIPLGTAFQIHDDYLGMFGTVAKTGKPIISDLKQGKKTLLILSALEKADKNQTDIINKSLGNKNVSIADLKKVRQVIVDTGSLDESEKLAIKYANEATSFIKSSDLKNEGKEFLLGIAQWMIRRDN